jgi:crotonobetainyl-CoA:carnitine CoA-transferase CaiB-like acyl-CoA transferase
MVQAMGGFMSVTGPADGDPIRAGIAIADLATGMFATSAILAALFARERTGEGQRIDMALLDSQVAMMTYVASNYLVSQELPGRYGNGHPNIVPYQSFKARDQHFAIAAGNDRQWANLCRGINHEEWIEDELMSTNSARVQNRELVVTKLSEVFIERDAEEWLRLCEEIGIPAAPINNLAQVFSNPQVAMREMKLEVEHPADQQVPLVGSPLKIPTNPVQVRHAPPLLGQHTDEILQEYLEFPGSKLEELRQEGII